MMTRHRALVAALAVVGVLAASVGAASADEQADVMESVLEDALAVEEVAVEPTDGVALATSGVEVPSDPSDGVALGGQGDDGITVELPGARRADDAAVEVVDGSAVAVYENEATSTDLVVAPLDGGGVQIMALLQDASAPTEQRYPVDVPDGAALVADGDGAAVVDAEGAVLAEIDPPWAVDATGADVPTWYEVDGTTLVQRTAPGDDTVFPIVVDPKFRVNCGILSCSLYFTVSGTKDIAKKLDKVMVQNAVGAWATATCAVFSAVVTGGAATFVGILCGLAAEFGTNWLQDRFESAAGKKECLRISGGISRNSVGSVPLSNKYCDA